jgi:hypothetical protein
VRLSLGEVASSVALHRAPCVLRARVLQEAHPSKRRSETSGVLVAVPALGSPAHNTEAAAIKSYHIISNSVYVCV